MLYINFIWDDIESRYFAIEDVLIAFICLILISNLVLYPETVIILMNVCDKKYFFEKNNKILSENEENLISISNKYEQFIIYIYAGGILGGFSFYKVLLPLIISIFNCLKFSDINSEKTFILRGIYSFDENKLIYYVFIYIVQSVCLILTIISAFFRPRPYL